MVPLEVEATAQEKQKQSPEPVSTGTYRLLFFLPISFVLRLTPNIKTLHFHFILHIFPFYLIVFTNLMSLLASFTNRFSASHLMAFGFYFDYV